jgi:hypothetical protein
VNSTPSVLFLEPAPHVDRVLASGNTRLDTAPPLLLLTLVMERPGHALWVGVAHGLALHCTLVGTRKRHQLARPHNVRAANVGGIEDDAGGLGAAGTGASEGT